MSDSYEIHVTDEMKKAAEEAEKLYGDLLHADRPVPKNRQRAPRTSRAAQFSPFAALTGYDAAIIETARLTQEKPELSEEQKQQLDFALNKALESQEPKQVMIQWFQADDLKKGGSILQEVCTIRKVNPSVLITDKGERIPLEDILEISEI